MLLARTKLYDLCRQELSALKKGFSSMFSPKLHRFISGRDPSHLYFRIDVGLPLYITLTSLHHDR